jgi:hypothetical protein
MDVDRALDHIHEIHQHLSRSEMYRGIRSAPVALSGLAAVAAGFLQPILVPEKDPVGFVGFWVSVAGVNALVGAALAGWRYWRHEDAAHRRTTRQVAAQFLPCLAAGGIVTMGIVLSGPAAISWLPGLWSILFGLGLFAARLHLPRRIGWIALYYFGAGAVLLALGGGEASLHPAGMASVFGTGQMLSAVILYWNLERKNHV